MSHQRSAMSDALDSELDRRGRLGYLVRVQKLCGCVALGLLVLLAPAAISGQSGGDRLILFGDVVYFYPPGQPKNCLLNNQFNPGEPLGFPLNPATAPPATPDPAPHPL